MRLYGAVGPRRLRVLIPSNRHATLRGQGVRTFMEHLLVRPCGAHPVLTWHPAASGHAILRALKPFVAVARRCRARADSLTDVAVLRGYMSEGRGYAEAVK
jgi:hypothetical protein